MLDDKLKELEKKIHDSSLEDKDRDELLEKVELIKKEADSVTEPEGANKDESLLGYFRKLEAAHPELTKAIDLICQSLSGAGI